MSDSSNGSHVTWRELRLYVGPIIDDVAEIKTDVKLLLERQAQDAGALVVAKKNTDTNRFWLTLAAAFITAAFAGALSALLYIAFA